jgi:hypothetical protein
MMVGFSGITRPLWDKRGTGGNPRLKFSLQREEFGFLRWICSVTLRLEMVKAITKLFLAALAFGCIANSKADSKQPPSIERVNSPVAELEMGDYLLIEKLHIAPSFRTPVCIEIFYGPQNSKLVAYRINNFSKKPFVELFFEVALPNLKEADPEKISTLKGILATPTEEPESDYSSGLDGDTYTLEIRFKDRYHRVVRWSPDYHTKERDQEFIWSVFQEIVEMAGVIPRPNIEQK